MNKMYLFYSQLCIYIKTDLWPDKKGFWMPYLNKYLTMATHDPNIKMFPQNNNRQQKDAVIHTVNSLHCWKFMETHNANVYTECVKDRVVLTILEDKYIIDNRMKRVKKNYINVLILY